VEAVYGDDPPPELKIWWMCKELGTPPKSGGILDQDEKMMNTMRTLDTVYSAVYRYANLKGEQIHRLTDSERRVLRRLIDTGVMFCQS
jgi:hypothetical protein